MAVASAFLIVFGLLAVFFGAQAPNKLIALGFIIAGLFFVLTGIYQLGG